MNSIDDSADNSADKNGTQATQKTGNSQSRLIGWLVSYALDEKGAAFEIRSGRSFISSQQNSTDPCILIRENGVAAPHCVLSASNKHVVMLQDIFTEKGTWHTKAGSKDEVKLHAPVKLGHGDWLRVGEQTRLQVCLIDGASR